MKIGTKGRRCVRCKICFEHQDVARRFAPKGVLSAIAEESGTISRKDVQENHLQSLSHQECMKAEKFKRLPKSDLISHAPLDKMISKTKAELANKIGSHILTVYNDAKRGTLSARSWPSRYVATLMGKNFDMLSECRPYKQEPGDLQYVNPTTHKSLLRCIVEADKPRLEKSLKEALAVSLRFDGAVDRFQIDNEHLLGNIVKSDGAIDLIFLGLAEPKVGGADGVYAAIQEAGSRIIPWRKLLEMTSSLASDGENMNRGAKNGIWAKIENDKNACGSPLPLLKMWCAVHRSSLAWNSVSNTVMEVQHIMTDAAELSSWFHKSSVRTGELKKVAEDNDWALRRFPKYFAVRWCQFSHQLLEAIVVSIRSLLTYFSGSTDTAANNMFLKWCSKDRLHLLCFLCDVMDLYRRFQQRLESDSCRLNDISDQRNKLVARLTQISETPLLGGWEKLFLNGVTENEAGDSFFLGFQLKNASTCQRRKSHHLFITDSRDINSVRIEVIESLKTFLGERLTDDDFDDLQPLKQLQMNVSDEELTECHGKIVPDLPLMEFAESYREAAGQNMEHRSIEELLKYVLLVPQWKILAVALARFSAAKPHSADVERIISLYNNLKTPERNSMDAETVQDYLYVAMNMPPLAEFDARPAVHLWLQSEERRPRGYSAKATEQEYFCGVFAQSNARKDPDEMPENAHNRRF